MRLKIPTALALALCVLPPFAPGAARARQDAQGGESEQKVIDDFIITRGVTFEEPGRKKPARTADAGAAKAGAAKKKPGSRAAGAKKKPPTESATNPVAADGAAKKAGAGSEAAALTPGGPKKPVGLGFTLFMKQGESLVAADLKREFRAGDRLRIALETNTDGYLYIFHTENGRGPRMLFPHPQVDAGANAIGAHARDLVPADPAAWFEFDDAPAVERLYLVVARSPLAGVPTGRNLLSFCGARREDCYWSPAPAQWERIKAGAGGGARVVEARNPQLAAHGTPSAAELTRGIKVRRDDPAPAVVRVNHSADADVFVTTIDLTHR